MTDWQRMQQLAGRVCLGVLALSLLTWAVDWSVWRLRFVQGSPPTASMEVTRMVVAQLKGNREEYYMDGTVTVSCSRSVFPQGGLQACWWLARHRMIFER